MSKQMNQAKLPFSMLLEVTKELLKSTSSDINATKYLQQKVHTNTSTNSTRHIEVLHSRNARYGTPGQRVVPHTTVMIHALNVGIVNIGLDSTVPHKSSSTKIAIKQDTLPAADSTEANKTNTIKTNQKMSMALPLKMVKMRVTPCQWEVTKNPLPAMKVSL